MAKASATARASDKEVSSMILRLVGDAPLICHARARKAVQAMFDKQRKKAKEAKNPEQDYFGSHYPYPGGGYGFPAVAFKASADDACSHVAGITKVEARGAFHVQGDLLKINGEPTLRKDMACVGMGTADICYRGQFTEWSVDVPLLYNANVLSAEQIVHLFNIAGFIIGVGEWRPQRGGPFGIFHSAAVVDLSRISV